MPVSDFHFLNPESRTLIVAEPAAGGRALTNTLTQPGGVLNGGVPVESNRKVSSKGLEMYRELLQPGSKGISNGFGI